MTPAQARQTLVAIKEQLQRTFRMVDGLLAAIEAQPEPGQIVTGCQHAHTVPVGTLGNPGGQFCLDCDQEV